MSGSETLTFFLIPRISGSKGKKIDKFRARGGDCCLALEVITTKFRPIRSFLQLRRYEPLIATMPRQPHSPKNKRSGVRNSGTASFFCLSFLLLELLAQLLSVVFPVVNPNVGLVFPSEVQDLLPVGRGEGHPLGDVASGEVEDILVGLAGDFLIGNGVKVRPGDQAVVGPKNHVGKKLQATGGHCGVALGDQGKKEEQTQDNGDLIPGQEGHADQEEGHDHPIFRHPGFLS